MRKTILSILVLAVAQSVAAQNFLSHSDFNKDWRYKPITVENGGQAPGVVTLLKAFQQTWPTWVANEVIKQANKPAPTTFKSGTATIYESEDDYRILIDKANGYVDLTSETDIDQMQACVWRKSDGHRIFAVSLYEQHDPVPNLLCWYDYDPQTQTLSPERSPLDGFKPACEGAIVNWHLPMKGTDFEIYEYYNVLSNPITHVYKWDKLFFKSGVARVNMFEYFPSVGSTHYEMLHPGCPWTHYALVDLTGEGNPVLVLGQMIDGQFTHYTMLAQFKGDLCQIGTVSPEGDEMSVYQLPPDGDNKRVAVQHRDLAGGFWYSILTGCYVQFTLSDLPNFANPDEGEGRLVSVELGYGAADESTKILDQLGSEIRLGTKLIWHPFEVIAEELP